MVRPVVPLSREGPSTPLGRPGEALLPASLRAQWADERLPRWVLDRAGGPDRLTYGQLTPSVHRRVTNVGALVEHVVELVQSRRHAITGVRVFEDIDPATRISGIEFSTRTRNILLRTASLIRGERLRSLTWGQLLSIKGLGVRSALEFALKVDQLQTRTRTGPEGPAHGGRLSVRGEKSLRRFARSRWARGLTLDDPRLGTLAKRDRRTVSEAITDALDAATQGRAADAAALLNVVDAMRSISGAIDSEPLELQLRNVIAALANATGERLTGLAARMGITGPRVTLRAAGEMAGVSGARLQQLQSMLMDRVERSRHIYLPAVDAAERALERSSPIRVDDAAREISNRGISRGRIDIAVLVGEWLPALGRRGLSLVDYSGAKWLIVPERGPASQQLAALGHFDAETDREIIEAGHRLCRSVGVASLRWVAEEVQLGRQESRRGVRRVVRHSGEFAFLDSSWFWDPFVPLGRNRLENTLRKVLAVAPFLAIDDLMGALDRVYRQGRLPRLPPASVVARFVTAHPSFGYDGDRIVAHLPLDASLELGQTERVFVEILSAVPGAVIDRESLRRACTDRGMNPATFAQYTSFSPILVQPGHNLWALRGRAFDEGVAQRLSAPRRRRRITTSTRTADGRLIVSWRIKGPGSAVFSIPVAELRDFADRDYTALDAQGGPVAVVRVDDRGTSWGYSPFLRATNAMADDRLVATFDRSSAAVTLDLERGADRRWVGDLGNCFLHDESWALRLYVDDGLLHGDSWEIPLSLADATGLSRSKHYLAWREDESVVLTVTRDEHQCTGSSLQQVLKLLRVGRHDRVFVELHTARFAMTHEGSANPEGDPLEELLTTAGVPRPRTQREAWSALSRALGGSSDGDREEVEERLRERGDQVALGLLHRTRRLVTPSTGGWLDSWEFVSELDPDKSRFGVRNRDGAIRVAIGTATESAAVPGEAIVDSRGLVWVDGALEGSAARALAGIDGVVLSGREQPWVRWARAEHQARRASLSGTEWAFEALGDGWFGAGHCFSDLRDGLDSVTVAPTDPILGARNQVARFPSSAFAFRRIVGGAVRDGLVRLRSNHRVGFVAEFAGRPTRSGVGLADVCVR